MAIDFAPLMSASLATKVHVATILPAFALGTWLILASRKGAPLHRNLGWVYLVLMTISARRIIASSGSRPLDGARM